LANLFPDVIVNIADINYPIAWGNFRIWGIPFLRYNDGLADSVDMIRETLHEDFINVLMIHTVLPGSTDTDDREITEQGKPLGSLSEMFDGFNLILCGHIHKHYYFGGGIYNVGAPIQQRLTDMGSRMGWLLVGSDGEGETVTKITPAKLPEFKYYKGEEPPDTLHFWIKVPEEKIEEKSEIPKPTNTSMKSLVKGYGKAMGFKGKDEELKRLIQLLEDSNND
jgi:DNA repair exonuclease SbcCD nuclease subunit